MNFLGIVVLCGALSTVCFDLTHHCGFPQHPVGGSPAQHVVFVPRLFSASSVSCNMTGLLPQRCTTEPFIALVK